MKKIQKHIRKLVVLEKKKIKDIKKDINSTNINIACISYRNNI